MKLQFQNNRGKTAAAMTLIEMLIATGIGLMVMAGVGTLMMFTIRSFVALGNYNDLDQASRNALDTISREIRQTTNVSYFTTNYIYFNNYTLLYWWNNNPNEMRLYRYEQKPTGWKATVLLDGCDNLRFGMSQRNPSNNFNFYATSTPTTAKLIDVSWTCSRQIFQQKVNTESVQTAKIVIRN